MHGISEFNLNTKLNKFIDQNIPVITLHFNRPLNTVEIRLSIMSTDCIE